MRYKSWLSGLLVLSVVGCSNMSNTQADTLMGGGAGAAAGAALTRGNPIGILFGALFGGLVGNSIGHDQDRRDARDNYYKQAAAVQAARQMSLNDIVQLTQQGQSDTIIINQILSTNSVFALTSDDINYLKQQRVSDQVIQVMQTRRSVVILPPPPGAVYVGPPPAPVGVGVVIAR